MMELLRAISGAMKFIGQCGSEVESLAGWHNR
jgi:hypothetical protein